MPIAGIVPVTSFGTTGARYTSTVVPVSVVYPLVPVFRILPVVLSGTYRHNINRETTTAVSRHRGILGIYDSANRCEQMKGARVRFRGRNTSTCHNREVMMS